MEYHTPASSVARIEAIPLFEDLFVSVRRWRRTQTRGGLVVVRYADDSVPRRHEEKAKMMVT